MGKKDHHKEEINDLKKEIRHLRRKISRLEIELEEERKIKIITDPSCDQTKADLNCGCKTHRAYRTYYMTNTPADSFEQWLKTTKVTQSVIISVKEPEVKLEPIDQSARSGHGDQSAKSDRSDSSRHNNHERSSQDTKNRSDRKDQDSSESRRKSRSDRKRTVSWGRPK